MIVDIRLTNSRAIGGRIDRAMAATERPCPWWVVILRAIVEVMR